MLRLRVRQVEPQLGLEVAPVEPMTRRVERPKPDGGIRKLGVPWVVDRLIQQALLQVLQKRWDPTSSEHSYGFCLGRSAHQAVTQGNATLPKVTASVLTSKDFPSQSRWPDGAVRGTGDRQTRAQTHPGVTRCREPSGGLLGSDKEGRFRRGPYWPARSAACWPPASRSAGTDRVSGGLNASGGPKMGRKRRDVQTLLARSAAPVTSRVAEHPGAHMILHASRPTFGQIRVPSRMLAKAVQKIVEPTLRIAIAFLLLILFQLSGQRPSRRTGEPARPPAPRMRSATAQTVPRWSWCRQANS